ncbi:MAG: bifunctional diaminohydroxyphosphoribosylaminopyrimidine deaminase/5-amino-6-(5-phosphoribosylamino)uracil reductase RibD [Hungatella sp.]|nr:bifunctional diaminohydroxyphosphoribosylaminopyrimidine deaminase/5-amino-6-(5-phosphoribosylamino)uracil reductase RibD [Hungatella sp.]
MTDRDYMERAICLAKKGRGYTNPNPVVGAVIVRDGKVIGEGYHRIWGGLHAEREAIASLRESARGASLYVTLEPCCHYGKTPPCTEAILEEKITRVVIGSRDPNPKVSGRGAEILRQAGVEVVEDFMREECDRLNPVFFHYITTGTPYVIMKYAMTADGKIATKTGASKWITGEKSRAVVHGMRRNCMGIMAGIGTVLADDPMLNVRLEGTGDISGPSEGPGRRDPVRIICDSRLRIPEDSRICRTAKEYPTIIACKGPGEAGSARDTAVEEKRRRLEAAGIRVVFLPDHGGSVDLKALMRYLGDLGIDSVLLEGGGELNDSALRAGIVREVKVFVAPKIFGGAEARTPVAGLGVEAVEEAAGLKLQEVSRVGDDILLEYVTQGIG